MTILDTLARQHPGWAFSQDGRRVTAAKDGWSVSGTARTIPGQIWNARLDMVFAPYRTARYFGRDPARRRS